MAKAKKPDTDVATVTAKPGKRGKSAASGKGASKAQLATLRRTVEKLEAKVEKLEAKRAKAQAKSERWKTEARQERTKVAKLEAKLRRTRRDAPVDHVPPALQGDLPVEDPTVPDASWTVAQLRAVAREKQVVGASRMTKSALLDALRG